MSSFKRITKAYDDLCNHAKTGDLLERESIELILHLLSDAANEAKEDPRQQSLKIVSCPDEHRRS